MSELRPTILLVEDSEDDVFLMQRAMTKAKLDFPLQVVTTGQDALDYLSGSESFSDRSRHPLPALIFLDLKLPYVHGFEILSWLRQQPPLRDVPVVVLTSSPEERDREKALALGAKAYLVKPPTPEMVSQAMRWLAVEPV